MYTEEHPVQFRAGIHDGTMGGLIPLAQHGLRINGLNPAEPDAYQQIMAQHRGQPQSTVQIGVDHPDPQTQRDIATIARRTIWQGRPLSPAFMNVIPLEHINSAANAIRRGEGTPEEGNNSAITAAVSSDMSVLSKWNVVALGEMQQPGGVGATQEYNPVVDGPNPDGPGFDDNAGNSPEQEVALQTWVNMAVDYLNRGESPEEILAKLAHDGCPEPEKVLTMAQQQPEGTPVSDQGLSDPLEVPTPPDPTMTGQMESTSQQPPMLARVRIAGTTMTGYEVERWEDLWGEGTVKIALDDGGQVNVAASSIEPLAAGEAPKHPVTEIQEFIDSLPEVKPTRPSIEAHLANLELVRRAIRSTISKCAFSDQVKLQGLDTAAEAESAALKEVLTNVAEGFEVAYAKAQPKFRVDAFKIAGNIDPQYKGRPREAGAIWASENFDVAVNDDDSFRAAAANYAAAEGMSKSQFEEFLAAAEKHRKVRTEEFATEPETADNEGPAEALFV